MARATFSFISPEFNKDETNTMQLLICVGSFSFSYLIAKEKQILLIEKYNVPVTEDNLAQIFDEHYWLQNQYQKVVVAHLSQYATVVPNHLFKYNAKEVLDLMYDEDVDSIKTFNDYCATQQVQIIYRTSNEIVRKMIRSFPNNDSYHLQTLLINGLKNNNVQRIVVAVIDHTFTIQISNGAQLLLSKTIVCDSNQSFLYNLLAFCKMYNCNTDQVQLSFVGWVTEDANLFIDTKKYFAHVDLIKDNSLFWNNELIESQYVALFNFLYLAK